MGRAPNSDIYNTSRREAEGPEYRLAAPNGLAPIQAPEAWRTAGQEETRTANTQDSHSGRAAEGAHQTLREPAVRSATLSE